MSGNSSRSWSSTSPIDTCARLRPSSRVPRSPPSTKLEPVATDLHLVAVAQRRLVDALAVHVRAVERSDVAQHVAVVASRSSTTWRRETVMSSRKMSESGWRPIAVVSSSRRNRLPAFGPWRTTSRPTPRAARRAPRQLVLELAALESSCRVSVVSSSTGMGARTTSRSAPRSRSRVRNAAAHAGRLPGDPGHPGLNVDERFTPGAGRPRPRPELESSVRVEG